MKTKVPYSETHLNVDSLENAVSRFIVKGQNQDFGNADVITANFAWPGFVHNHQTGTRKIKNNKDSLPGTKIYHQIYFFDGSVNGRLNSMCEPGAFNWFILKLKRQRFRETHLVNMLALQRPFVYFFYSLFRLRLLPSVRSTGLFFLAGKQARMGTCKAKSDGILWLLPIVFHIHLLL